MEHALITVHLGHNLYLNICALVLDIDGVLTDGRVLLNPHGHENKSLCYRDIDAVFQARREGLLVALVTGELSPMVDTIADRLAIQTVISGAKDKVVALQEVCRRLDITLDQVCYIGDSDRDAPALAQVGLGLAPSDASVQARLSAHRVLTSRGGYGAVAEGLALICGLNTNGQMGNQASVPPLDGSGIFSPSLQQSIVTTFEENVTITQAAVETLSERIAIVAEWIGKAIRAGCKLLFFGDRFSAHYIPLIAGEFVAHFGGESRLWPAGALDTGAPIFVAPSSDNGMEKVVAHQLESLAQPGDLALAFSTNGDTPDVIRGATMARGRGLRVISLTGQNGGRLASLSDLTLCVPSLRRTRIQECQIAICHAICEALEAACE